MPSTKVEVLANDNGRAQVQIDGWQQDGVSEVFYAAPGKRILSVLVGDAAKKSPGHRQERDRQRHQPHLASGQA
jgi:trimethylamine-N-oxide reductase cytochrome c-type subunit TorC